MPARTLPRHLDDLRGLRAARWVRVSTSEQQDNYGPDSQRAQQDGAISRIGLTDTGLSWQLAHSGYATDNDGIARIASDPRYIEMLSRAGTDYDVLLVAYVSRMSRNAELLQKTRRMLHAAGAVIFACDERMLSTDTQWIREAADAEVYSARLGVRITEGHEAKWRRYDDPPGWAALGYRRSVDKPRLLAIDLDTSAQAVALYEQYATGTLNIDELADMGIARMSHGRRKGQPMTREGIADVLANPVYRGVVAYMGEQKQREDLRVVPDDLWWLVQEVRQLRSRGGGPRNNDRVDMLSGLLFCADCGASIGRDGYARKGESRRRHKRPCASWGRRERKYASTWEMPMVEQVKQLDISDQTLAMVRIALRTPPASTDVDLALRRVAKEREQAATAFGLGDLPLPDFLAKIAALGARAKSLAARQEGTEGRVSAEQAVSYIRSFADSWGRAGEGARSGLLHAIIGRVNVRGPEFVSVELTRTAEAHGLALTLPEYVSVERTFGSRAAMACPRGLEPPTFSSAS